VSRDEEPAMIVGRHAVAAAVIALAGAALAGGLTLDEKVARLGTDDPGVPRLGVPPFRWVSECVHGVVARGATVYPQAISLAATWDPAFVGTIASAIGDEARDFAARGEAGLVFFSPVLNMARDPRWGRTQETYGEDPLLVTRMGLAFVRGLQGNEPGALKVAAVVKHFAANNVEDTRHTGSSKVTDRDLRDYYLPQFKAAVVEGRAAGVMCAYNALNGVPCCANRRLLTDVLRGEWGFEGFVVTDCGAIGDLVQGHRTAKTLAEGAREAVEAGVDLDCGTALPQSLAGEVRAGRLPEAAVDRALARLDRVRAMLDRGARLAKPPDRAANRALALEAARRGTVLLRNPGELLPFPAGLKTIAVIGPSAARRSTGDYSGWGSPVVTPLDGIRALAGPGTSVIYARGCEIGRQTVIPAKAFPNGLKAEYFAGAEPSGRAAVVNRVSRLVFSWSPGGEPAPVSGRPFSVRVTGRLIVPRAGRVRLAITAADGVRMSINGTRVINQWSPRPETTDIAPLQDVEGTPLDIVVEHFATGDADAIRLGWDLEPDRDAMREAVAAARAADACVVVVGTDRLTEYEGSDRQSLALPGDQPELIRAVTAANPRTVVVLECGSVVRLDWAHPETPAVMQAWFPGEEGGTAIAGILFGKSAPGGRLPLTWYASEAQLPPMSDYALARGRTYMYLKGLPAFPFGYGLTYTTFQYANLRLSPVPWVVGSPLTAVAEVTNTGSRTGDEVVQCYVAGAARSAGEPALALADFTRVTLEPGETKTVTLTVPAAAIAAAGEHRVMVGPDSSTGLVESFEVSPAR